MLPEKRRNLIIGIVAVIVIILLVLGIYSLSKYIKNKSANKGERNNDSYPSSYVYYGVMLDDEGVYKVYGIGDTEEYLDIKTFYEIKDIKVIDNKLVMYSDATNELRYEKKNKEFYLYELDSNYEKEENVKLSNNYLISEINNTLSYYPYGNKEEEKVISNGLSKEEFLVNGNIVYYVQNDGVYKCNMEDNTKSIIIPKEVDSEIDLFRLDSNYMYLIKDGIFYSYYINSDVLLDMSSYFDDNITFVDSYDNGFLYMVNVEDEYTLKKFNLETKRKENYEFGLFNEYINFSYRLDDSKYYMQLVTEDEERNVIVDIENKQVVRELDNLYINMVKVG